MRCSTVRGMQEFLFRKLGYKVFGFFLYVLADLKSPEKHVGITFNSEIKDIIKGLRHKHDNT
jgi:hypothetical protein